MDKAALKRGEVAAAIYDTYHTARLSEHPEDAEQYGKEADRLTHWLGVRGLKIIWAKQP